MEKEAVLKRSLLMVMLATFAAGALTAAGCGSDNNDSSSSAADPATTSTSTSTTQTTTDPPSSDLKVKMTEFAFAPANASVKAGKVKLTATNIGQAPHELVVVKTNTAPGSLPTNSKGEVEEDKLDVVGEVADVTAGKTKSTSLQLKAGTYAMICNIPGHYKGGMYGSLTAK